MKIVAKQKLYLLFLIGCAQITIVRAADYYMTVNGSDNNPGTLASPFANADKFAAIAKPGDVLFIRGGTYNGQTIYLSNHDTKGTAGNPITFRNYPGEVPIFDGANAADNVLFYSYSSDTKDGAKYILIQGLVIINYKRSGINMGQDVQVTGTSDAYKNRACKTQDITVRYCVVDKCGQNGIAFFHSKNITIERSIVSRTGWRPDMGSWSSGINFYQVYGYTNYALNNITFHHIDISNAHTDGNGIINDLSYYTGGIIVKNNVSFLNGGSGIQMTNSAKGVLINNTVYENSQQANYQQNGSKVGIGFWGSEGADQITVKNNNIYQTSGIAFFHQQALNNPVMLNNNITGEAGYVNSMFADPNNADFSLQSGSPLINKGVAGTDIPTDAAGFDKQVIKPDSWTSPYNNTPFYKFGPDIAYIQSKGGLENCYKTVNRPQGNAPDIGAYESPDLTGCTKIQQSFFVTTPTLPGRIEAEKYDDACPGEAYYDTDAGNAGTSTLRNDDVDIKDDGAGNTIIGWNAPGEWREYAVNLPNGNYTFTARVATSNTDAKMLIKLGDGPDGKNFMTVDTLNIPNTSNYTTFQNATKSIIIKNGGNGKVIRLETLGNYFDIDWFEFQVATGINDASDPGSTFSIYPNPNPASGVSMIAYHLPKNRLVKISVYDLLGKEILQVVNESQHAGEHRVTLNSSQLQNGIYILRMSVNGEEITQKLIVNKSL